MSAAETRIAELEGLLAEAVRERDAALDAAAKGARLRALVEASNDILHIAGADGKLEYASPAYDRVFGGSSEDVVGTVPTATVHPDDMPAVLEWMRELFASDGSRSIRHEYRRRHKSGAWIHVEAVARNLLHDPAVRGIVTNTRQVDDRLAIEHDLREAQLRYELASRAANSGLWELDVQSGSIYWAPLVRAQLGYSEDELRPTLAVFEELVHAADRAALAKARRDHIEHGVPYDVEYRLRTKSGEHRWFHSVGQAQRDERGETVRMVGYVGDVHARKLAALAVRDSERKFRALFEGTHVAVTIRDTEGQHLIDCNPAALRLYGCTRVEDLAGKTPLAPPLQADGTPTSVALREVVERALRDGHARAEWLAQRIDGEVFSTEIRINVIELEGGRVMQTQIDDISDRKAQERALAWNARRDSLVAGVSRRFVNGEVEGATGFALESLSQFLGVDRARVRRFDGAWANVRSTHEWCAEGRAPWPSGPDLTPAAVRMIEDTFSRGETIVLADLAAQPKEVWGEHPPFGIAAAIVAPLAKERAMIGWLTVVMTDGPRSWTEEEVALVRQVCELISLGRARAEAEVAMRESEARYRSLVERSRDAIFTVDLEGRALFASPSVVDVFGYTPEEWTSAGNVMSRIARPGSEGGMAILGDAFERAKQAPTATSEWAWRRKDGRVVYTESKFAPIRDTGGVTMGLQVIARDVTERRRAEEDAARRASQQVLLGAMSRRFLDDDLDAATDASLEHIATTFDAERVSLFAPDAEGARLRCTHRWCKVAGDVPWESLDAYPLPPGLFTQVDEIGDDSARPARAGDGRGAEARDVAPWLATLQRDAGRRLLHAPVGYGGRILGLIVVRGREDKAWTEDDVATLQAIGELVAIARVRRAAEAALAKAKEDAIAASASKSAFLANMSHELRTPLNGVIGMVDLLTSTALDERQRRYAQIARGSAGLLLSVINDILDFSKIEAGKLELEHIEFSFAEVFEEVASILAFSAEEKGLDLRCASSPELSAPLFGDPGRIRQVLVNLVSNAVKFTSAGGVTLRATYAREPDAVALLRVEVRDTGVGIDREAQSRLFQPFVQVDASTTRVHGGTGLGLAICRELVERMGGAIGVVSEVGAGSTFWFELHLRTSPPSGHVATQVDDGVRRGRVVEGEASGRIDGATNVPLAAASEQRRVLLVEDSAVNAEIAGEILRRAGYAFDVVVDGKQAVLAATRRKYAIILMDCQLPELDGYEATRRIRAHEKEARAKGSGASPVPILALTASVMKGDVERCLAAGMNDHVSKPIDPRRLLAAIGENLRLTPSIPPPPPSGHIAGGRAVVDMSRALKRLSGNRALLRKIATQFAEDASRARTRLRSAVEQRDAKTIAFLGHRLRGQGASFDADAFVASVGALEDATTRANWSAAGALLLAVEAELDRLLAALAAP